jgi:hypothetical protein
MTTYSSHLNNIIDLDFMFSDSNRFGETSIADVEKILESEFDGDEPVPQAVFRQDFSAEKWQKNLNLSQITQDLAQWMKYLSDPDEPQYITIPFHEYFREDLKGTVLTDTGKELIRTSRSMRDYFRYWSSYQDAIEFEASLVRPNNNSSWTFGCSSVLGIFMVIFLITGVTTQNMGGALPFLLMFGAGIYWLVRSGRRNAQNRINSYEEKAQDAAALVAKTKKKLLGFLERNSWFESALNEVLAAAETVAEKFITDQEAHYSKVRESNKYIDATESKDEPEAFERRTAPSKMKRFSPRDYEVFCAGWVEYLGGKNVRVTQQSADGGIDIVSDNEVAQVKLHGSPVSVQPIRELFGVAHSMSKTPLFFTSTGYTQAAITFAEANDVFLFIADPVKEDLKGVTEISRALKRTGLTLNRAADDVPLVFGNSEGNAHSGIDGYEDGHASDGYLNR